MKNEQYKEAVNSLVRHIQDADAIVVGGASGMSAAAGFRHYYEHDKDFIDNLGEFEKKYGYRNSFDG
ncbi:NAD-dependent protein deacetylase, partial [Ruminococcus sp. AF14-5]